MQTETKGARDKQPGLVLQKKFKSLLSFANIKLKHDKTNRTP